MLALLCLFHYSKTLIAWSYYSRSFPLQFVPFPMLGGPDRIGCNCDSFRGLNWPRCQYGRQCDCVLCGHIDLAVRCCNKYHVSGIIHSLHCVLKETKSRNRGGGSDVPAGQNLAGSPSILYHFVPSFATYTHFKQEAQVLKFTSLQLYCTTLFNFKRKI